MKRRIFLRHLSALTIGSLLPLSGCRNNQPVSFGICTDVHKDLVPDANERMQQFMENMNQVSPDFIIQLGDFCFPNAENQTFLDLFNQYERPHYHVLGNHDMDTCDKRTVLDYWGAKMEYYSFDQGPFHFIVLDPNFFLDNDKYVAYSHGNYYAHPETHASIPSEQLNWLKNDLVATNKSTIIFSHQGFELMNGVHNQKEVRHLLESSGKVIACFAGHHHTDLHTEINNIHYLQMNSMSYQWVGEKYKCDTRYEGAFNRSYPSLKYTAPYQDPLFALVKVYPDGRLIIEGVQSVFIPPTPDELGMPSNLNDIPLMASIGNRELSFTTHSKML